MVWKKRRSSVLVATICLVITYLSWKEKKEGVKRRKLYGFDRNLLNFLENYHPTTHQNLSFESCPRPSRGDININHSDLEHLAEVLENAPVLTKPFKYWTFMCHVFPEQLYDDMLLYPLPLDIINEDIHKGSCYSSHNCGRKGELLSADGCFKYVDLKNFKQLGPDSNFWAVTNSKMIYSTWVKVYDLLSSNELQKMLWKKLDVLEAYEGEVRVRFLQQIPLGGGIPHTDAPNTAASFFFNLPSNLDEIFHFGTRYLSRDYNSKYSLMYSHQVRYFPNSGYAFRTVPAGVGKFYQPKRFLKENFFTEGKNTRIVYKEKNVTFPSWHNAPPSNCTKRWRSTIFVTYPCLGKCRERWGKVTSF
jgi:hypothetical protein